MGEMAHPSLDIIARCVPGTVLDAELGRGGAWRIQQWMRGGICRWGTPVRRCPHLPSNITPVKVPRDLRVAKPCGHCPVLTWLDPFTRMVTLLLGYFLHMCSGTPCSPGSVSPHYPLLFLPLLLLPLSLKPLNAGRPQGPVHRPFLIPLCTSLETSSSLMA